LVKDQRALGLIQTHCTTTYKLMIKRCKTAKEAWDKLADHFKKMEKSHTELNKAINAIDFSWTEGIDKYVQSHQEARQRFEDAGIQNTESFYLSTFYLNLPEEFENVVDILENDPKTKTIDDAMCMLSDKYRKIMKKRKMPTEKSKSSSQVDQGDRSSSSEVERANNASTASQENQSQVLLSEMAESIKLLSARMDQQDSDIRTKKRKFGKNGTCTICGGPDTHAISKCWANPESIFYRPNWSRSIAVAAQRQKKQEETDHDDGGASALVGQFLRKSFGKS
jgi:hypothetical protein